MSSMTRLPPRGAASSGRTAVVPAFILVTWLLVPAGLHAAALQQAADTIPLAPIEVRILRAPILPERRRRCRVAAVDGRRSPEGPERVLPGRGAPGTAGGPGAESVQPGHRRARSDFAGSGPGRNSGCEGFVWSSTGSPGPSLTVRAVSIIWTLGRSAGLRRSADRHPRSMEMRPGVCSRSPRGIPQTPRTIWR